MRKAYVLVSEDLLQHRNMNSLRSLMHAVVGQDGDTLVLVRGLEGLRFSDGGGGQGCADLQCRCLLVKICAKMK